MWIRNALIMKSKLLLVLIIVGLGYFATAQNVVVFGKIFEEESPLPFASVIADNGIGGTSTNESGIYSLTLKKGEEYEITASYVGYFPKKIKLSADGSDSIRFDFELKRSAALEEVVVTGTMKPSYVSESPIKIDVISFSQLETFMPVAGSSIVENIKLVNGVQEVVACGVCFTNSISINGLPGPYTAVLMDGTPMYGNLASVYGLNGIPSMIIDRMEIIKGPSSTLYGSEAVAGVINIITKDPSEQPLVSLDIMGTSHKESFGNLAIAPKIGETAGYIGLNYAYVNDFDDSNNDGFGDGINMDRISAFTKWDIHRKSGKEFSIVGRYYYEDRRNGVEEYLKDRNYRDLRGSEHIYGESIYTNRMELFGTYEFNMKPDIKVDFSLSDHQQDSYYGTDFYKADQQIAFANLLWNKDLGYHDLLFGLTNRYQAYDDNTVATEKTVNGSTFNHPNNQWIPGVFVQDEFRPVEKWILLGGMRMDHYENHGLIFAPRLNIKFKPSVWTTYRLNFGTGFRIVNLFTEDHAFVTGQREVIITEELNPEQSYNASFNINHIYSLFEGSGSIDIDGYYTHFTNKINPDYSDPGQIIYSNSDGYARTMGIGVNVNYSFTFPLGLSLGMNIQDVRETEILESGQKKHTRLEFAPRWSGVATANFQWRKQGITMAYTARITGDMELPEVYDLDESGNPLFSSRPTNSQPFSIHTFQVIKKINDGISIYAGLQNIWDYRQDLSPLIGYNDPNSPVGFSDHFDTVYAYSPNHGREFYLGVRWNGWMRK